jgi:hypothetical protein
MVMIIHTTSALKCFAKGNLILEIKKIRSSIKVMFLLFVFLQKPITWLQSRIIVLVALFYEASNCVL